jgi:hypothetical protein
LTLTSEAWIRHATTVATLEPPVQSIKVQLFLAQI